MDNHAHITQLNDGFFQELQLSFLSRQTLAPGQELSPSLRFQHGLLCTLSGAGQIRQRSSQGLPSAWTELPARCSWLCCPEASIHGQASSSEPWECLFIGLSGSQAKSLFQHARQAQGDVCHCRDMRLLEEILSQLEAPSQNVFSQILYRQHLLFSLLTLFLPPSGIFGVSSIGNPGAPGSGTGILTASEPGAPSHSRDYVERAVGFIEKNYARPLTITEIAAEAGISRNYLFLLFRKTFKCPPQAYLRNFRLERAKHLLSETGCSVDTVASACGFQDTAFFSRCFRQRFGCTPTAWRKQLTP